MRLVKLQVRRVGRKFNVTGVYRTASGKRVRKVLFKKGTIDELHVLLDESPRLPFDS